MTAPTITRRDRRTPGTQSSRVPAGTDSLNGQLFAATHRSRAVEGSDSPEAKPLTTPTAPPLPGPDSLNGQEPVDNHRSIAVEGTSNPTDQYALVPQASHVGGAKVPPAAISGPTPRVASLLADPFLALLADVLDDLEDTRIGNENRYRALTRNVEDSDGEVRGFGLTDDHPAVARLGGVVEALKSMEHEATLSLQRAMRKHPLGPWVKAQKGVGDKQAARLLASLGDPYWNTLHDRPRTVSELWAYCGLHTLPADQGSHDTHVSLVGGAQTSDPDQATGDTHGPHVWVAAKRRKGQKSNWSANAKSRAWLVAVSCMKTPGSPWRDVYLDRRARTKATHPDWTDGHSHNDALRIVSKELLKGLWRESKRIHEETS